MKHIWYLGVALVLLLTGVQAQADTVFKFEFNNGSNPTIYGSGTLDAIDNLNGTFNATSGSGTFYDTIFGTYNVVLIANAFSPNYATSPLGSFWYDDLLYPASNPYLDNYGLLFGYYVGSTLQWEVNIWGNGPSVLYTYYVSDAYGRYPVAADVSINFNLVRVPEPGILILLGIALSAVGLVARRYRF